MSEERGKDVTAAAEGGKYAHPEGPSAAPSTTTLEQLEKLKKLEDSIAAKVNKSAVHYLQGVKAQLRDIPDLNHAVEHQLSETAQQVVHDIERDSRFENKELEVVLQEEEEEEVNVRKSERFEDEIRKSKLKEVKRMKEELELKLETLNENANFLSSSPQLAKNYGMQNKDEKEKTRAELEEKAKEAHEFITKLTQERRERKQKEKARKREMEEKMKKESEELRLKLKEKEGEMIKKRKEETMKTYMLLKQKRDEDSKKNEEHKTRVSLPPRDDYLYKKIEERYNKEVLLPMLEDKKKELAKIRNQYKSVRKDEIEEHMRKHELLMAQKEEGRVREVQERRMQEGKILAAIKQYKTPSIEKISMLEHQEKEAKERKSKEKKILREKMESYASLVKETVPVKINEEKVSQLKQHIEQLKTKVRPTRSVRKEYELAALNKRGLLPKSAAHSSSMDKLKKSDTAGNINEKGTDPIEKPRHSASTKHHIALKAEIQKQEERKAELAKSRKMDYLTELRLKREENYKVSKPNSMNWMSDLKNEQLNQAEKYTRLVGKANLIEEKAKMKEKLLAAKGGTEKNPEMGEYVSDMYLDAIKAKLSILENL